MYRGVPNLWLQIGVTAEGPMATLVSFSDRLNPTRALTESALSGSKTKSMSFGKRCLENPELVGLCGRVLLRSDTRPQLFEHFRDKTACGHTGP